LLCLKSVQASSFWNFAKREISNGPHFQKSAMGPQAAFRCESRRSFRQTSRLSHQQTQDAALPGHRAYWI
jgi:hypothetical protein